MGPMRPACGFPLAGQPIPCHAAGMISGSILTPILRGFRRRCPACGKGRLFAGYLKLKGTCEVCGQTYSHDQAADGPAWLTVLVLGPVFAPMIFLISMSTSLSAWLIMPLLGTFMFTIALTLLAHMKGAWIGGLWHMSREKQQN